MNSILQSSCRSMTVIIQARYFQKPLGSVRPILCTQNFFNQYLSCYQYHENPSLSGLAFKTTDSNNPLCNNLYGKPYHSCGFFTRQFHTTRRRSVPPFLWIFVKPVTKLAAILAGRGTRGWWRDLDKEKQTRFQRIAKELSPIILAIILTVAGIFGINYWMHLEYAPITGRRRFIAFTKDQYKTLVQMELNAHMDEHKSNLLPSHHHDTQRVVNVVHRLCIANKDWIEFADEKTFHVVVINNPSISNAFVLPTGHIFVFTGLLNFVKNDDQLGIVLGHEMSHAILSHGAEHVSFAQLLDWFVIVSAAAIWSIIPSDYVAFIVQYLYQMAVQVALDMPYSRAIECEADNVGIKMAAKACFDIREAPVFWKMIELSKHLKDEDEEVKIPEWLSTHPSHENRSESLDDLVPKMLKLREECNCPKLSRNDPRNEFKLLEKHVKYLKEIRPIEAR